MGIRFFCPNGHKLNVKEHLAGKAGFCPECGARLIIPLQSTRKSSKELSEHKKDSLIVDSVSPAISAPPEQSEPTEQVSKSGEITNPILQDQTVVWYIQVPGGQQHGPLTGQVIHSWIQEHRIEPTMLIWREGWENWLQAKNVFTELETISNG
ncbi:MAG: DUF4339 domain-containing protein [Planctomycetaceae bacterium]|jgi:predicted RNA-binding Zn-ribbon protein involved in translation (DUF1610 family)|nr:DUF4339 domain-containing protein [Planctomycetaceae bacterium]